MNQGRYLIGEVSRITGISKDTLHFYSKTGLLVPDCIDASNQYRYYSRFNLWQLDIITTCRKLNIPLERIRQILSFHDNKKVTELLMEYRNEALRLSEFYRQVADDISWYGAESLRIDKAAKGLEQGISDIRRVRLEAETVIAGVMKRDESSYHANLQEAVSPWLRSSGSIRRRYGYMIDPSAMSLGQFRKFREYVKPEGGPLPDGTPDTLYTIPAGEYAVFILRIQEDRADFGPFLLWLKEHDCETDAVYADELGLQLFDYIGDYYCEVRAHLTPSASSPRPEGSSHFLPSDF